MSNEQEQEFSSNELENEEQTEEQSSEQSGSSQTSEDLEKKIKELEGQKNYYQEQYKKLKNQGEQKSEQPDIQSLSESVREEAKQFAKGRTDEDVEQLKAISQGKGISMSEAEKDPLFTGYLNSKQQEEKSEKAQLGASGGSPQTGGQPTNRDERKQKFEELKEKYGG